MSDDNKTIIKRTIRALINEAVMADAITPEDGLAILLMIAATYIAQVDDDAKRLAFIETIQKNFGFLVAYSRGISAANEIDLDAALAMAEAATETRQ